MNLDWNHILDLALMAVLGWVGFELRAWRIWWMQNHGGAPDAADERPKQTASRKTK